MLEKEQYIAVTLGMDYLGLQVELVNYQENGVESNQHAIVSTDMLKVQGHKKLLVSCCLSLWIIPVLM